MIAAKIPCHFTLQQRQMRKQIVIVLSFFVSNNSIKKKGQKDNGSFVYSFSLFDIIILQFIIIKDEGGAGVWKIKKIRGSPFSGLRFRVFVFWVLRLRS